MLSNAGMPAYELFAPLAPSRAPCLAVLNNR